VSTQPSQLASRIHGCTACDSLPLSAAVTVRPFVKPCSEFDIYTTWKPEPVSVVFIAEAPPGNSEGYFYDPRSHPGYREILRTELFKLLRLEGIDTAPRLAAFKARGYVLLDAVKCRCKKTDGQPPQAVTTTCGRRWLRSELDEFRNVERICVLGRAALRALSQLEGFEGLGQYSVRGDCGRVFATERVKVLIWPFLGWRNERVYRQHLSTFERFCFVPTQPSG